MIANEIKAGKLLKHPNVIPLMEVHEYVDCYELVFPFIEGVNLLKYMQSREFTPLPEVVARPICMQLTNAVEYCHSKEIAHMDIKLENIMISKGYKITLIDFGLSEPHTLSRLCISFGGSYEYAAPELLHRSP